MRFSTEGETVVSGDAVSENGVLLSPIDNHPDVAYKAAQDCEYLREGLERAFRLTTVSVAQSMVR